MNEPNMVISQSTGEHQAGEQPYRHLFNTLPVCILVADLTVNPAVILEINRRTEPNWNGYPRSNPPGSPSAKLRR